MSVGSSGPWRDFGDTRPPDVRRPVLRRAFEGRCGPPCGRAGEGFGRLFAQQFRPHRGELFIADPDRRTSRGRARRATTRPRVACPTWFGQAFTAESGATTR
ncbi:hypothetical protein ACWDRR_36160 [Kitasatospora sp. NPDC003701]